MALFHRHYNFNLFLFQLIIFVWNVFATQRKKNIPALVRMNLNTFGVFFGNSTIATRI